MLLTNRGLGDTTAGSGIDASFLGGSVLTAAVIGVAMIVAFKMFPAGKKRDSRRWVSGAWRSRDYEELSSDFGVRPGRRGRRS